MHPSVLLPLIVGKLVQVQVDNGILEGQIADNEFGSPYYSFKGIPYAEPPVGDLRFKAPVPKKPWEGVRSATQYGNVCYHYEIFTNETIPAVGSEDCLFLNVFTPDIQPEKPLPVMVWVHGGGFVSGSGNDDEYGPEFLVRKGVILVTLNYRLAVLGFLSLDTEDIPGNAGMKDQATAMRWVKKNIKYFGGDPDNITIFGESAGGASVSFHLVSPMSKGLFKRAIVQSGALTSPWPNTFRARDRALTLARELGCTSNDDKEVAEFLRNQPLHNLIMRQPTVTYIQFAKESPNVYYGIVSESQFGDNERFFYGNPYDVVRQGIHEGLEIMNGYTEDEGILYFSTGVNADRVFEQAPWFLEFFVPEHFTTILPLTTQVEIGKKFKDFHMGNRTLSKETLDYGLKYFNMEVFVYGTIALQKMIAKSDQNKNYLYKFTCKSERNIFVNVTGLDQLFDYRPVVAHADDLGYLFPLKYSGLKLDREGKSYKMIEQTTTLWTNFAKYGDPTPDDALGVKWKPYTLEEQDYLDIGEFLVPGKVPEKEEMEFWESNYRQYAPHLAP